MEIASCDLYLQPITNGAFEEKFASEFFSPYFIASLHAITEHGEVILKGVSAANLLPDGINRVDNKLTMICAFVSRFCDMQQRRQTNNLRNNFLWYCRIGCR